VKVLVLRPTGRWESELDIKWVRGWQPVARTIDAGNTASCTRTHLIVIAFLHLFKKADTRRSAGSRIATNLINTNWPRFGRLVQCSSRVCVRYWIFLRVASCCSQTYPPNPHISQMFLTSTCTSVDNYFGESETSRNMLFKVASVSNCSHLVQPPARTWHVRHFNRSRGK